MTSRNLLAQAPTSPNSGDKASTSERSYSHARDFPASHDTSAIRGHPLAQVSSP